MAKKLREAEELGASTAKKGIIYLLGEFITSIMVLALLIVLARLLKPADFGLYSIAVAFVTIIGIGSNFGIGTAFRKMLAEVSPGSGAANRMLSNGFAAASAVGLAIALVAMASSGYLANSIYHNPTLTLPLQIASFSEFLSVMFNLSLAALTGLGRVKETVMSNVAYSLVYLLASVALVFAGFGVAGAIAGMALGLLSGSVVGVWYMAASARARPVLPDVSGIKELTRFSVPVVVSHIANQGASNFSVALLGVFAAPSVVGNYGIAYRLARFVEITLTSTGFILLPTYARALSRKSTARKIGAVYNYSIYYTALFLLPVAAYSVSVSIPLTGLLFSSAYGATPFYFSVIIIGMVVSIIGQYAGNLVIGHGDTKRFMAYQLIVVAIQLALLLALTPKFLADGVLLALWVVSPIALDIIYMVALERQFRFKHTYKLLLGVALASIAIGVALYYVSAFLGQGKTALAANAAIVLLAYPPLVALFGGINRKALGMISEIGGRMGPLGLAFGYFVAYTGHFVSS